MHFERECDLDRAHRPPIDRVRRIALFCRYSVKISELGFFPLDQTQPLSRFRLPDDERGSKNEANDRKVALLGYLPPRRSGLSNFCAQHDVLRPLLVGNGGLGTDGPAPTATPATLAPPKKPKRNTEAKSAPPA